MNWNAIGAIATVASLIVAISIGVRSEKSALLPPYFATTPTPIETESTHRCIALKLPDCSDNINNTANEIITNCKSYIGLDSKSPLAYSLLGRAYRSLGQLGEAEGAFEMQLQLGQTLNDAGTIGQAYYNLATIGFREGMLDRAEFYVKKSLEQAGNSGIARAANYKVLGDIYFKKNDFANAEGNFNRSVEFFLQTDDKLGLGGAYTGLAFAKLRQRNRDGCLYLQKTKAIIADIACFAPRNENERYLGETKCN
jgi:tetratricopeptide (TPR) repeat protein